LLEDALQQFEGDERIELLFELADVYDDYEEFDKVFDCLKLILEEEPTNEEALYKICFWTDFTGRNEESIKLHLKIIDDFPYNELAGLTLELLTRALNCTKKQLMLTCMQLLLMRSLITPIEIWVMPILGYENLKRQLKF
jgi:tetratricopeptide (TPR) repeat protein